MSDYGEQAKYFKLLMHPARLAILEVLREGEECVCHMETALGYRQAYISQQLMVLRDTGVVKDRRDGWNIFYYVARPEIYAVLDAMAAMTTSDVPRLRRSAVQRTTDCPCPKCNQEHPITESDDEVVEDGNS
jgi:ArsR family transcriptional regulator